MSVTANPELEVQSRYVLLSSLAADRRVLDIGGDMQSVVMLAEAGPTELTTCSDQPATLKAQLADAEVEGIDVTSWPRPPFTFNADSFDFIICHDLGEFIQQDPRWMSELRRVLAPEGYIVLALANPNGARLNDLSGQVVSSGLTYEEAFEKLSDDFGTLTVFVQSPLVGNLFYDLESTEEEPDLAFDRSLLSEDVDEAGWYVLVFGPEAIHRDDLTIVQVPFSSLSNAVAGRSAEAQLRATGTEPPVSNAALEALEKQKATLEEEKTALEQEMAELDNLRQRVKELEASGGEEELQAMLHSRIEQLKSQRQSEQDKLNKIRTRLLTVEDEFQTHKAQLEQDKASLAKRVTELEARPAPSAGPSPLEAAELDWLRQRIKELESLGGEQLLDMLRERIKQLKIERRRSLEKLNKVRERMLALEAENADAQRLMPLMHERIKQLKLEQRVERVKLNNVRQRLLALEASHADTEQMLPMLRGRIEQLKSERSAEQEKLNSARAKLLDAESRLEAAVGELGSVRAELESSQQVETNRSAELEQRVAILTAERDAATAELDQRVAALTAERDAAATELGLLRGRVTSLKTGRADAEAKLATLREQAMKRDAGEREASAELSMLRERIKQLKVERRQEQEKLLKVRERLLKIETVHDDIAREHRLLGQRVESLKQERDGDKSKLASLRAKLLSLEADRDTAVAELQLLRERVNALKIDREAEKTKVALLRDKLQGQQAAVQVAEDEMPMLRERVRSLVTTRAEEQAKVRKLREKVMALEAQAARADDAETQAREHSAVLTEQQEALANSERQLDEERQRGSAASGKVTELEEEVTRHVQDKKSFESQIKDLLDEVNQLRDTSESSSDAAEALREEKIKAEGLREELARLQTKVSNIEAENQGLAAEVQRLTDALHEQQMSAEQRTPPDSVHDAETVIARNPLVAEDTENSTQPQESATGTTRDAVGRPIETSLEDIEDLIAGSVPPSPNRR